MYIEEQYIQEQFTNNFLCGRPGNIVIYGTGIHTKHLLENIQGSKIIGLMDVKRTGEFLWGYRVLSYEEVAAAEDIYIVILARNAVINIIYRRIEQFCKEHQIDIFDINGNNLHRRSTDYNEKLCFSLKEYALIEEIKVADIVTFDVFDTLLVRSVMRPRDLFKVMENTLSERNYYFAEERIKAEEALGSEKNPNIYEIYRELQKNIKISDEKMNDLLELEIYWEKHFLRRREKMCRILAWAVASGKEVYLISDMYLPENRLEEILKTFQIEGYKKLFVSCGYRKSKQEGLFSLFKKEIHGEQKACLHIGDNFYSDIVAAEREGFRTFRVYSAVEMLESSLYSEIIPDHMSLEENILIADFAVHAYNDPFGEYEKNGKLIIQTIDKMIKLFAAPVIFKFMLWLMQNIKKNNHDVIIFPSRDGFLLKKVYELFQKTEKEVPDFLYLYTSRRAAMIAAARTVEDIKKIMEIDFFGDMHQLLKVRFGIEDEEICKETLLDQDKCLKVILQHCSVENKNYLNYLQKTGLAQYKNVAILDFVAMGSVQEALQRLLNSQFTGYYFLKRSTGKTYLEMLQYHSLYKSVGDFQNDANIYKFYYFLESILTSCEPSFYGIDENGEKVFYTESRKKEELELLCRIHDGIVEYCRELLELLPDIYKADSSIKIYDQIFLKNIPY